LTIRRFAAAAALAAAGSLLPQTAAAQARPPRLPRPSARPVAPARDTQAVRVSGMVIDSISGETLAGAIVQLVRADSTALARSAVADSAGVFAIPAVAPGRYIIGFLHPLIDALGIEPPQRLIDVVAGQPLELDLATPSGERIREALCGPLAPGDSSGALVGTVRDADAGTPIAGAKVVLTWRQLALDARGLRLGERRAPATARVDGSYSVCGVPSDVDIVVSADAPGRTSGLIELRMAPRGLRTRDIALGDTVSARATTVTDSAVNGAPARRRTVRRGTAQLTGVVRDSANRPVPNATVLVVGSSATARSGEDGRFRLDSLPAGTYSVEARAIGFAPGRAAVDLASGATRTAAVRLIRPATTLSAVVVKGKREIAGSQKLADFEKRRTRGGFGSFITAEDIERRRPIYASDVLRTVPGMRVSPSGNGFGQTVTGRGNCQPTVYLDGQRMFGGSEDLDSYLRPNDIAGIEVYNGPGGRPAEYQGDCVIAVFTK
jgi:protocatechuate 3,4-dioxygenase beta subunit